MSKKQLATELYQRLKTEGTLTRKKFIEEAQKPPLTMTPAGASTYYVNCKNDDEGKGTKSYYKPASERRVDNSVDDSKADAELYSVVIVDGLQKTGGAYEGLVDQAYSFMSEDKAMARFSRLSTDARKNVVVAKSVGAPKEGQEVSSLQVLASGV